MAKAPAPPAPPLLPHAGIDRFERHEDYDFIVDCHPDGSLYKETWRSKSGERHRLDGPAQITYFPNGDLESEVFLVDGKRHRTDGPAVRIFHSNGTIAREEWRIDDELHRIDGPARIRTEADGSHFYRTFEFENTSTTEVLDFVETLRALEPEWLRRELEASSYRSLLEEGTSTEEILAAMADEVFTIEGVRAHRDGAPAEWVRSFEEGSMSR